VKGVAKKIMSGESVVIHSAGGTGRTGTVTGRTLRELGYTSEQVLETMKSINTLRDRALDGWPEFECQSELVLNLRVLKEE